MSSIFSQIRDLIKDFDSPHRKIAIDFFWVFLFVAIGKIFSIAKETSIAWRYGTTATVDAYVFLFNLAGWPVAIWFSVLNLVLVPIVIRVREAEPIELVRFQREFFGFAILMGLFFYIFSLVLLRLVLGASWVHLNSSASLLAAEMSQGLALFVPFSVICCFLSAWMIAYRKHANNLLEGVPAIAILAMLLLPLPWVEEPLVWGTVLGYICYMVALIFAQKHSSGLSCPVFSFRSTAWRHFWGGISLMVFVQFLINLAYLIDQFFAANIGADALSVLGYVNRVMAVIVAVGVLAISRTSLPILAEISVRTPDKLNAVILRWLQWIFFAGVIVTVIGCFLAPYVVQMLFERGAFSAEDTEKVSEVLRYALVQVPFYACLLTLSNFVAAQKKYKVLLIATLIGLVVKVLTAIVLTQLFMLNGLLISTAFSYLFTLVVLGGFIVNLAKRNIQKEIV